MHWRGIDLGEVALHSLALQGSDGRKWYDDSWDSIKAYSDRHGFDPGVVADVLAILSPRVTVDYSIRLAKAYLETGVPLEGTMKQRQRALTGYRLTGTFGGPKVNAFSQALRGDPEAVVIDAWMYRALRDPRKSKRSYTEAVIKVRAVADRLGWPAAETQAAIWMGARSYVGYAHDYRPMDMTGEVQ